MIFDFYCQGASDPSASVQLNSLGSDGSTLQCVLPGGVQSGTAGVVALQPISITAAVPSGTPAEMFIDGNLLGWGVAAAMAAAWSLHVLRRAI